MQWLLDQFYKSLLERTHDEILPRSQDSKWPRQKLGSILLLKPNRPTLFWRCTLLVCLLHHLLLVFSTCCVQFERHQKRCNRKWKWWRMVLAIPRMLEVRNNIARRNMIRLDGTPLVDCWRRCHPTRLNTGANCTPCCPLKYSRTGFYWLIRRRPCRMDILASFLCQDG